MEIEAKSLQLLMELGLLAGGYGYVREAETIFEGLKAVRPQSEYPLIGWAIVKMSNNQIDESTRVLEKEALKVNPGSDLARGYLGLALMLAGRAEQSIPILEEVVNNNKDEAAVNLAKGVLEEIDSKQNKGMML
jgi:predicted Zn-dependent protease